MAKLTLTLPGGEASFPLTPELAMMVAEILLKQSGAIKELNCLIAAGCDRRRLLFDLGCLLGDPAEIDTWVGLLGFNRKQTNAALRGMRTSAGDIQRMQRSVIGQALMSDWPTFRNLEILPEAVRLFAKIWEAASKGIVPREHLALNTIKARLVRHVLEKTRRPHDREVSALINALRPKGKTYDEVAHRNWRNEYMPGVTGH